MIKLIFQNKKLIKYAVILNIFHYLSLMILFYMCANLFLEISLNNFLILWSAKLIVERVFVVNFIPFFK